MRTLTTTTTPASGRTLAALALVTAILAAGAAGCRPPEGPTTEKAKSPVAAPALQATLTAEPGPSGFWPEKIGRFSASFEGTTWYPSELPEGFAADTIDVIELEPQTGLVCDVAFFKGEDAIVFTQGSSLARQYDIEPVGTVAWGVTTAQVVHEDPTDTTSARMIVLSEDGALCELSGTVDLAVLEAVAKSMTRVK